MKKFLVLVFFALFAGGMSFSQNSASVANRTTAIRCLKLAESCLTGNDFESAKSQAELGLSYDDSISDLFYIKAAACVNLGYKKAEIIQSLDTAFEKNNWVDYTTTGARILYADLLSDRGDYEKSLKILDDDPFIYSADAEFVRIKNYYRMGSQASISQARNKTNAARRIYASDYRFMQCFFYFEVLYLLDAEIHKREYIMPDIVRTIAASYLLHLPDYSGKNQELELMASFFAEGDEKDRLIRAIDAKDMSIQPLLAIAGLRQGLYTDKQAFDLFFQTSQNKIQLNLLQCLCSLIKDEEVRYEFSEKMTNFEGIVTADLDFDLQDELTLEYKKGRPSSFEYSFHNDGIVDLRAECDLGSPKNVKLGSFAEISYYDFPEVSLIYENRGRRDEISFEFLRKSFDYKIFEMKADEVLASLNLDFYIPLLPEEINIPSAEEIRHYCNQMKFYIDERDNASLVYTMFEGQPVEASFYEGDRLYASCSFTDQLPFVRLCDYDGDRFFETEEFFNLYTNDGSKISAHNKDMVSKVFSDFAGKQNLFLNKVCIDRNGNKAVEFSEEYTEDGDTITIWDNNDDGIADCMLIKYYKEENEPERELTVYYDSKGNEKISMLCLDQIPVKIMENKTRELIVYAGEYDEVFWIEEKGSKELESELLNKLGQEVGHDLIQGRSLMFELGGIRVSVIEVGSKLFFRIVPDELEKVVLNEENQ